MEQCTLLFMLLVTKKQQTGNFGRYIQQAAKPRPKISEVVLAVLLQTALVLNTVQFAAKVHIQVIYCHLHLSPQTLCSLFGPL